MTTAKKTWGVASWNVNSVRLRKDFISDFLKSAKPDFLSMQEIKCLDEEFPKDFFASLGYPHQLVQGQKAYHGVAILSRHPFINHQSLSFGERAHDAPHARHVFGSFASDLGEIGIHNFYVPAGGDIPDIKENDKFAHKLRFIKDMTNLFSKQKNIKLILTGDLNIAPYENDVWSHKQLLDVVSHTPIETQALKKLLDKGDFVDIARRFFNEDEKLYSWWSYRARDWRASNRGRRLDHIWTSADIADNAETFHIESDWRDPQKGQKPSDHVPIVMKIKF